MTHTRTELRRRFCFKFNCRTDNDRTDEANMRWFPHRLSRHFHGDTKTNCNEYNWITCRTSGLLHLYTGQMFKSSIMHIRWRMNGDVWGYWDNRDKCNGSRKQETDLFCIGDQNKHSTINKKRKYILINQDSSTVKWQCRLCCHYTTSRLPSCPSPGNESKTRKFP